MKNKIYPAILFFLTLIINNTAWGQASTIWGQGSGYQYQGTVNGVDYFSKKDFYTPSGYTYTPPPVVRYNTEEPKSFSYVSVSNSYSYKDDKGVEHQMTGEQGQAMMDLIKADSLYGSKKYSDAFRILYKSSTDNFLTSTGYFNSSDEVMLGYCYSVGAGTSKNDAEAAKWFQKSADQGNADGQFSLGCIYFSGSGVTKSEVEALKWFQKSADQGNTNGEFALGSMYSDGKGGLTKSPEEAMKWYEKAAEGGNTLAEFYLGFLNEDKDEQESFKWYKKAAEHKNAAAEAIVGSLYAAGSKVVTKDEIEAAKWLKAAAEAGAPYPKVTKEQRLTISENTYAQMQIANAEFNLANFYQDGKGGLAQSNTEAQKWYLTSADAGGEAAMVKLGEMYQYGTGGVAQNDAEAVKWYQKVVDMESFNTANSEASVQLAIMYMSNQGGLTHNDAMEFNLSRKAALQGDDRGQLLLGLIYENKGVAGLDSAKIWIQKAADQGNQNAKEALNKLNGTTPANNSTVLNGPGSYTSDGGTKYEGNFKNGKLDGHGTMSNTKATWTGEWVNGILQGHGTYKTATASYDGEWKDSHFDGHGTYITDSGANKYVGTFKAGLEDGQGTYTYSDGTKYEGGWKDNMWSGDGIYTSANGDKTYASYVRFMPMNCKYKVVSSKGITKYEAVYVDSLREGKSTWYYDDGKINGENNYKKGVLDGNWKTYYEDGKIWQEGTYKNGNYDGNLKGYYKNGVLRVDCTYSDGKLWNISIYNKPDGTSSGCSFKDGAGEVKWYYDDGKLNEDKHYKNGVQDGEYKSYYENGALWSDYIYQDGKLWNCIADNMPDGKPTGSSVKDGNGITMSQSSDGATIIGKTTWQNGIAVKQETFPAK
jgi:TPR repeat protein